MIRLTFAALGSMLATASVALGAPAPLEALYACAPIADTGLRAACYDTAASNLKSAVANGQVTVIDNADLQSLQKDVFGFQAPSLPVMLAKNNGAKPITTVNAKIATLRRGAQTTFTMDDGQIWRQVDTVGNAAVREGDAVRIERRVMGSYLLFPPNGGGAVRVARIN